LDALHLVPAYAERLYGAGHWKACQAMTLSLKDLRRSAVTCIQESEDGSDLPSFDGFGGDVIVEYSRSPEMVADVRRRWPRARVHVRAINAEAWQHVHRVGGLGPTLRSARTLYAVCRLLERDSRCRRLSATILSISEWDATHYWSWLPGAAPVLDVPYFSPWPDLRPSVQPRPWNERDSSIVCLPGAWDAIGRASAEGFYALARLLSAFLPGWRYRISAGVLEDVRPEVPPPGLELMTDLSEPWDLLCGTKAVAVLTPLGFGAKTTIYDALAAGCRVLVHPALAKRLPDAARRQCIVVDPEHPEAEALADLLRREFPPNDVNTVLRERAAEGLATAFDQSR
jgi:hypothetical protein